MNEIVTAQDVTKNQTPLIEQINQAFMSRLKEDQFLANLEYYFRIPAEKEIFSKPSLSFYLFDVHQDLRLRQGEHVHAVRAGEDDPHLYWLSFNYLITYWDNATLQTSPDSQYSEFLDALLMKLMTPLELPGFPEAQCRFIQTSEHVNSVGTFWQSIGQHPHLALTYEITAPVLIMPEAQTAVIVTGRAAGELVNAQSQLPHATITPAIKGAGLPDKFTLIPSLNAALGARVAVQDVDVRYDLPNTSPSKPTLSLYLADVHEELSMRQGDASQYYVENDVAVPAVHWVSFNYLITYWEPKQQDAQMEKQASQVMSYVLEKLLDPTPFSGFSEAQCRFIQTAEHVNNLGAFWKSLDQQPRLALTFEIIIPLLIYPPINGEGINLKSGNREITAG